MLTVEATRMRHVLQWNEQSLDQGLGYLGGMSGVAIVENVGLDIIVTKITLDLSEEDLEVFFVG